MAGEDIATFAAAGSGLLALAWLLVRNLRTPREARGPRPDAFGPIEGSPVAMALVLFVGYQGGATLLFLVGGAAGTAGGIAVIALFCWFIHRHAVRPLLRPAGTAAWQVRTGLLYAWAAMPLVMGTYFLFAWLGAPGLQSTVKLIRDRGPGWQGLAFLAVVLAPVAEELCFRGLLYPALRRRSRLAAVVATSLAFGLVHSPIGTVVPLAVLGVFLAYATERTGSVLAPIAAHMAFNAFTVALLLVF